MFHFDEGDVIARAFGFRVCQPVFSQLECLFPFEEIEAVDAGFFYERCQLPRWERADLAFGVNADPEKYFVLDNVADPGKDILVEKGVGFFPARPVTSSFVLPLTSRIFLPAKACTCSFRIITDGPSGIPGNMQMANHQAIYLKWRLVN